jgi:hypothetical protein
VLLDILLAIVTISMAVLGGAVSIFPPKTMKMQIVITGVFLFLGGCAIFLVVKQSQKTSSEQKDLRDQIRNLVVSSQFQANSDDVRNLRADIKSGFDQLTGALTSIVSNKAAPSKKPSTPELPPPVLQGIRYTQRRTASTNPAAPYGLQVIIQTDSNMQPVGFALECDGEIDSFNFFVAGQSAFMNVLQAIQGPQHNMAVLRFGFPPLTPESPLVVTIFSKQDLRVIEIKKLLG